ncbi:MAG: hypothetical protein ACLQLG_06860 [Thermoguttaceae bacterium]
MNDSPDMTPRQRAAVLLLIVAVSFYISSTTIADPDLWGHVRFGQDMLAARGIPAADPYSYLTAGQPWINHEWLTEVVLAGAFGAAGSYGLLAVKAAILLAILGLLYRHLAARGVRTIAAGVLILAVVFLMEVGSRTIRPQLFSYLFFLLMLLTIEAAERNVRALWLAVPLIAVWANFHGAFFAGLGLLAVWSATRIALVCHAAVQEKSPWLKPCCQVALPALAAAGAAMLNPYGPKLFCFLWAPATAAKPDIMEWQPLDVTKTEGIAFLVLVGVSILALAASRRQRRPALLAAFASTIVLPLVAFRHLPLTALAAAVLAGPALGEAWNRWLPAQQRRQNVTAPRALTAALLPLTGAMLLSGAALHPWLRIPVDPRHVAYPVRAVALLRDSGVRGNLAVFFDWGQYVIWRLGPKIQVSYDGRRDTVYSESLRALNNNWISGVGAWDALLDEHPTDLALVDKRLPVYNLMRLKAGWTLVYEDALCGLFARSKGPLAEVICRTAPRDLPADGAGTAFPE